MKSFRIACGLVLAGAVSAGPAYAQTVKPTWLSAYWSVGVFGYGTDLALVRPNPAAPLVHTDSTTFSSSIYDYTGTNPNPIGQYSGSYSHKMDFASPSSFVYSFESTSKIDSLNGYSNAFSGTSYSLNYSFISDSAFKFVVNSTGSGTTYSVLDYGQDVLVDENGTGWYPGYGDILAPGAYTYINNWRTTTPGWYLYEGTMKQSISVNIVPVPEPESWAMMIGGFGVVGIAARRNRRRKAMLV